MHITQTSRCIFFFVIPIILATGCIFDGQKQIDPLTMTYVGAQNDTISPIPSLKFAFSAPVASSLDFTITPPVSQPYAITFNARNDTATLSFLDMLEGNTRYCLRIKESVDAANGARLDKSNDSIIIVTGAREHEPNNSIILSDTLKASAIYGILSTADDTDVYCIPIKKRYKLYLLSSNTKDTVFLQDSMYNQATVFMHQGKADTMIIPDTISFPVFISVFSALKGTNSTYKLGVVP